MTRTTARRRAAGTGLGVLAATTALALAAPSATAATTPVVLEPAAEDRLAVVVVQPLEDVLVDEDTGAVPLPADGVVTIDFAPDVLVDAATLDVSVAVGAEEEVLTAADLGVVVEGQQVSLTIPVDELPASSEDDDLALLLLDGLALPVVDAELFTAPVLLALPAEEPTTDAGPLDLRGFPAVGGGIEGVSVQEGGELELQLPAQGLFADLGFTSLADAEITLVDAEGLEDAVEQDELPDVEELRSLASSDDAELVPGLVDVDVTIGADGRTATVALPDDADAGAYALEVAFADGDPFSVADLDLLAFLVADVEVTAAPVPAPTVTVSEPAPTVTTPTQNPGLRSNTGVEGGVPGLSSGQLVGLGGGLLAVAALTGAVALRTHRRDQV